LLNKNLAAADRQKLFGLVGNKHLSRREKMEISRIIWESGAIEFCMQFVEEFSGLVTRQYVNHINETPTRLKWIIRLMDITPLINKTFRQLAKEKKWKKLEPSLCEPDLIERVVNIK
jgi:hypothetical protein